MDSIDYVDTLNIAYLLKNFLLFVQEVEPCETGRIGDFYLKIENDKYIRLDEFTIESVKNILHCIEYSVKIENNKLIIENE